MEFIRKKGFRLRTNPQVVGEVCQSLEQQGKLTPKNLVDVSRDEKAPLHKEFEWRDGIAAEKYRQVQAGYIIRSVAIKITEVPTETQTINVEIKNKETEVRYFHAVDRDADGYDSLETICKEDKYEKLMENCINDLQNFNEKYCVLRESKAELGNLFREIDNVLKTAV